MGVYYRITKKLFSFLIFIITIGSYNLNAQSGTASPSIQVTDSSGATDILVDCDYPVDADRCFELIADFTKVNETVSYEISSVMYSDPLRGLTEDQIIDIGADDQWSSVLEIPFSFCFFNDNYDSFVLGDNGVITFDTSVATLESQYIKSRLPSGNLVGNSIFGVFHDMLNVTKDGCFDDPATPENECGEIKLYTKGTEPQRSFIISYEGMNHFACDNVKSTTQIILYETSNVIEVYVKDKPINCEFVTPEDDPDVVVGIENRKNALIGIQNKDRNLAYTPTDRNNSVWSTTNEVWRFTPNGSPLTEIIWKNEAGLEVGNGDKLKVCPEVSTTYTASVTYDVCIGDDLVLEDSIPITIDSEFPVATDIDEIICDLPTFGEEMVDLTQFETDLIGVQTGLIVSYHENLNQAKNNEAAIADFNTYLVNNRVKTLYARLQRGVSCFDIGTIRLTLTPVGVPAVPEIGICDQDNDNEELIDLTDYNGAIIGSQVDMNLSYHFSEDDATNNNNPQTELNAIPGSSVFVRFTIGSEELCPYVTEVPVRLITKPEVENIPIPLCDHIPIYDLTQHESIINGLNTIPLEFSYYITRGRALNGTNEIPEEELEQYVHRFRRTIYVRAQGPENCFDVFELNFTYLDGIPVTDDQRIQVSDVFDLTESINDMITNGPNIDIQYVICGTGSPNAIPPIPPTPITGLPENYVLTGNEGSVCVVFTNLDTGCINDGTIDLTSTGGAGRDGGGGGFPSCDFGNDGSETFTLSDFEPQIIDRVLYSYPELLTVTFHEIEADAIANTNEITEKTITATETIYIRLTSYFEGVELEFWTDDFTLEFKPTTFFKEVNAGVCDVRNNNREIVDLTQYEDEILDGKTGGFSYFDNLDNEITSPELYRFIGPTKEIKVIVATPDGCENETKITLNFDPPIPVKNVDLNACDFDRNREEMFNLNDALPDINEDYLNFTASYYTTQTNADNQTNPIVTPESYLLNRTFRRVYVRLEDRDGCYNTTFIDLRVVATPSIVNSSLDVCDFLNDDIENDVELSVFDRTISGNTTTTVVYYETEQNAIDQIDPVEKLSITPTTNLYVNLISGTDCIVRSPITFNFLPTPEVQNQSIIVCDNELDSKEIYDLTQHESDIIIDPLNKNVTYYRTLDEADREVNRITTITVYPITSVPQTVFVRVEDVITGCYSVANLDIDFTQPLEVTNTKLSKCDVSADGSEIFDVTTELSKMVANPDDFEISYYSRREAALNVDSTFLINDPTMVDTTITSIVYIRFYDSDRGCYSVGEVFLELLKTPKLLRGEFDICDTDLDNVYTLNLTDINTQIISDTDNLKFTYFNSFSDANENINVITTPNEYKVEISPQRVYARVEAENACFSVSFVDIKIDQKVAVEVVTEILESCDENRDKFALFNLTTFESQFTLETGATFKYYNSRTDIANETNEILNPTNYQNVTPDEERIYVRVSLDNKCDDFTSFLIKTIRINPDLEDVSFCAGDSLELDAGEGYLSYLWSTGETSRTIDISEPGDYEITLENENNCKETFTIKAEEIPLPLASDSQLVYCDDAVGDINHEDGFTAFNLEESISELNNRIVNTTVYFYETEEDLENDIRIINTNNFTNTENPQTLFIKVEDNETLCFNRAELTLRVSVILENNATIEVCDELMSEDGLNTFTLTDANSELLERNVSTTGTQITYYKTFVDAEASSNPLMEDYNNISPYREKIFARIQNEDNCHIVSEVNLIVNELPPIGEGETVVYCQNSYPETITLFSGIEESSTSDYTYEWSTGERTSTIEINEEGIYTVKVTSVLALGCNKTKEIVVESKLIEPVVIDPVIKCDDDGIKDGKITFVLADLSNEISAGNTALEVSYFLTEAAAINSEDEINSRVYINNSNPQTIYAKVLDPVTSCYALTTVTLNVSFIAPKPAILKVCDSSNTGEGIGVFDLFLANSQVTEGLPVTEVLYFESVRDARLLENQLTNLYTNTEPFAQEIFSRIVNENGCVGIGKVTLLINDLPNIPLEETVVYCVDTFPETITIDSGVNNVSNHTYNWNTGESTSEIQVNEPGFYSVVVTNENGCKKEKVIKVITSKKPVIDRIEIKDREKIGSITVFTSGTGEYEYSLDDQPYQDNNFFNNVAGGFHTVFVRDKNECGITEESVSILEVPNFFTPNNDSINDYWKPRGISDEFQANMTISIFNRYGKLLEHFNSINSIDGWDGTYNGKPLPSTDYWFKINYQEVFSQKHIEIKGHFSLIR